MKTSKTAACDHGVAGGFCFIAISERLVTAFGCGSVNFGELSVRILGLAAGQGDQGIGFPRECHRRSVARY